MTRRSAEVPGPHHGGLPIPVACVVVGDNARPMLPALDKALSRS